MIDEAIQFGVFVFCGVVGFGLALAILVFVVGVAVKLLR